MLFSLFYAILLIVGIFLLAVFIVFRIYNRFKKQELVYKEIMATEDGVLLLLASDLKVINIYLSEESDRFYRILGNNSHFLNIVAKENHELVLATFDRAFKLKIPQTVAFRLSRQTLNGEDKWYKLNVRPVTLGNGNFAFACSVKNVNDIQRLQNLEETIAYEQKSLQRTSFDILWKLDIESRKVTLLNGISFERHGAIERAPGVYSLQDLVFPQDYNILEEKINFRVREFLKLGYDPYEQSARVVNVRMRAPEYSSVWHGVSGFVFRSKVGKLYMYGSTHRILVKPFVNLSSLSITNIFNALMQMKTFRVFWCNNSGQILGGNENFILDSELFKDVVQKIHIPTYTGKQENLLRYFYSKLSEISDYSAKINVIGNFEVSDKSIDDLPLIGSYNLIPLKDAFGKMEGGLFVYWFFKDQKEKRDFISN